MVRDVHLKQIKVTIGFEYRSMNIHRVESFIQPSSPRQCVPIGHEQRLVRRRLAQSGSITLRESIAGAPFSTEFRERFMRHGVVGISTNEIFEKGDRGAAQFGSRGQEHAYLAFRIRMMKRKSSDAMLRCVILVQRQCDTSPALGR